MHDRYENPLSTRYADKDMSYLFSDDMKFRTWRRLWVALAEAEHEMGLPVTEQQIAQLKEHVNDIDYEAAAKYEQELRHDVMAHIRAYGDQCPDAKPIIHLGATSCYVTDNTDLIIMDQALELLESRVISLLAVLMVFADEYKDTPALAYTHLQTAQPTTVGKRATLWMQDLVLDLTRIRDLRSNYMLRGVKGTTGTQASFMELFDGDYEKVEELERRVLNKIGYLHAFPVTGQTYPRKFDSMVLDVLCGIAESAYKFSQDVRLLQGRQEYEEPFELTQVGSSAMAYKRNPIRCERLCGIARFVMSLSPCAAQTAALQGLERTLDDSAAKRLTIPQAFLGISAVLNLYANVAGGLTIFEKVIANHMADEVPFLATEAILMEAVRRGADRQSLHEKLRQYSMQARYRVKVLGEPNTLLEVIAGDSAFHLSMDDLTKLTDVRAFIGAAPQQVERFIEKQVRPIIEQYGKVLSVETQIIV